MAHYSAASARRAELQGTAALVVVAIVLATAFGLSTLITRLYLIYQQQFDFSETTLTLIYAAYVIGNIAALLFFGRMSDHIGRRFTTLSAIAILIIAALVFLFAQSVAALSMSCAFSAAVTFSCSKTALSMMATALNPRECSSFSSIIL